MSAGLVSGTGEKSTLPRKDRLRLFARRKCSSVLAAFPRGLFLIFHEQLSWTVPRSWAGTDGAQRLTVLEAPSTYIHSNSAPMRTTGHPFLFFLYFIFN